jgi:hypothetical protein
MRRLRAALSLAITLTLSALLLSAPAALATSDGGQGLWGEINDKVTTYAGFILIAFFPLFIFAMSMLQGALDRRKQRRQAAKRARATTADWGGGW